MDQSSGIFSRERLTGYVPERLAESVALVVGAGALGQNVALDLALAGIGEIRIVDRDVFESHNRTRSPLFPLPAEQERYSSKKAPAVANKLLPLMTAAHPVVRYAHNWIQALGDGAFAGVSVVLACVDRPSARAYLSDKARLHGIALVEAGFDGADLSLSCYPGVRGDEARTAPCWRCSHQQTESEEGLFSCLAYALRADELGVTPAIQNAAATLGGLQAEAAILSLHEHIPSPLNFRAADLNIRTGESRVIKLSTDPICPGVHHSLETSPIELETTAVDRAATLLQELSSRLTGEVRIELTPPLVWAANCSKCAQMTTAHCRMWEWAMNHCCQSCGGPFPIAFGNAGDTPHIIYYLDTNADEEVLNATCAELGFPPLALFEVTIGEHHTYLFQLAGSVEHLYELGENNGEQ
jgi:molybdopterin/thiamine biosynthesis adenylyltransferase